jgi:hypothetical protein
MRGESTQSMWACIIPDKHLPKEIGGDQKIYDTVVAL